MAFRLRNLGSIPLTLRREFGSLLVMWTESEVCPVRCGTLRVREMPSFAAQHVGAVQLQPSCLCSSSVHVLLMLRIQDSCFLH